MYENDLLKTIVIIDMYRSFVKHVHIYLNGYVCKGIEIYSD